ncbi:MAG: prepilin-type N-terminal cleavage/methylation domain-containing protein [SAR324 cluster bacterium]|nr:prepilin-type N-terminal cleavage/methylation domain-containing protein [SAR324 cluster bacterium]
MSNQKSQRGFSLLELLLAIALMVSVTSMITVIIFQSSKSEKVTAAIIKNRQESRFLKQMMERDFNGIVYLSQLAKKNGSGGLTGINMMDNEVLINQVYLYVNLPSLNNQLSDSNLDPLLHEVYYVTIKNFDKDDFYSLYRLERFYVSGNFSFVENTPSPYQLTDPNFQVSLVHDKILSIEFRYVSADQGNPDNAALDQWQANEQEEGHKLPVAILTKVNFMTHDGNEAKLNFQTNLRPMVAGTVWDF